MEDTIIRCLVTEEKNPIKDGEKGASKREVVAEIPANTLQDFTRQVFGAHMSP